MHEVSPAQITAENTHTHTKKKQPRFYVHRSSFFSKQYFGQPVMSGEIQIFFFSSVAKRLEDVKLSIFMKQASAIGSKQAPRSFCANTSLL